MYNQFTPDYAVHPGEYLEEVLESRDIQKQDFANRCGLSVKAVSQILNGKSLFSSDAAIRFERVLGIKAELLMNLVSTFQLFESRRKEKEKLELTGQWLKRFPEKQLIEYRIIPHSDDVCERADSLLDFFNVSTPEIWEDFYTRRAVSYRKSPRYKSSLESTITWLRIGEKFAETVDSEPYNKEHFKTNIRRIRDLTRDNPESYSIKMVQLCRESGVALVFVPELEGTHISGATQWLSSKKGMIIMSLRSKSDDQFWFTFFHEAAHILLHSKKAVFIDSSDDEYSEYEREANQFSRDILIDPEAYADFVRKGNFYPSRIKAFAREQNIAPGIVVGRLQHDQHIESSRHNSLKQKLEITQR